MGLGVGSTLELSGLAIRLNSVYVVVVYTSGVLDGLFCVEAGLFRGVRSLSYPIRSISILAFSSKVKPNFFSNVGGRGIGRAGRDVFRYPKNPFDVRLISLIFLKLRVLELEDLNYPCKLILWVKGGLNNPTKFFLCLYFIGKAYGFRASRDSNHP